MTRPWKPLEEMDHDELRRYAHDLVKMWVNMPIDADTKGVRAHLDTVGMRMTELGINPVVTLTDAAR